jgi:hypothetical protein
MTFEEMCKARDPLYAEMEPCNWLAWAIAYDLDAEAKWKKHKDSEARDSEMRRDVELFRFTIRALHNQGETYYPSAKES